LKADIVSFPKAPGRCGSGVHERGRLASKRDQQKWNPVLRLIALQQRTRDQQKWFPVLRPARMVLRILASPFWLAY
jgi:transposase